MNLQAATTMAKLQEPIEKVYKPKSRSAVQVAKRVFQLAAQGGFPYKKTTPEKWAKKWLSSKEFTLMEIDINAAASPHIPKNPNRVAHYMHCAKENMDPIVVDLNKRKVGMSLLGYIPEVIKLDGKHRSQALLQQGHTKVLAWVGNKAAKKLVQPKIVYASKDSKIPLTNVCKDKTKIATAYEMYCAVSPSVNIPTVRQDAGEGGSRPSDHVHAGGPGSGRKPGYGGEAPVAKHSQHGKFEQTSKGATNDWYRAGNTLVRVQHPSKSGNFTHIFHNEDYANIGREDRVYKGSPEVAKEYLRDRYGIKASKDCNACGARSSGSLVDDSSNDDHKVPPNPSDASTFVDPSDQLKWDGQKAQMRAPGTHPGYAKQFGDPDMDAPGSGSGPKHINKGASGSDMSRALSAKGKMVPKIFNKKNRKKNAKSATY